MTELTPEMRAEIATQMQTLVDEMTVDLADALERTDAAALDHILDLIELHTAMRDALAEAETVDDVIAIFNAGTAALEAARTEEPAATVLIVVV